MVCNKCRLFIFVFQVRKKANVKYFYNADLDFVYLTISNADGCIECIYLASPSSATIDLTATETIRMKLINSHGNECSDPDMVQLILAIVDPNTTIVYYKLNIGLHTLDPSKANRLSARRSNSNRNELCK